MADSSSRILLSRSAHTLETRTSTDIISVQSKLYPHNFKILVCFKHVYFERISHYWHLTIMSKTVLIIKAFWPQRWRCHMYFSSWSFMLVCRAFAAQIDLFNRKKSLAVFLICHSTVVSDTLQHPQMSFFSMMQHLAPECRPCFKKQGLSDQSMYAPFQKKSMDLLKKEINKSGTHIRTRCCSNPLGWTWWEQFVSQPR